MVYVFSAVMIGTVLFLLFMDIVPDYTLAFLPIAIIGLCDGMWHAVPPSKALSLLFYHFFLFFLSLPLSLFYTALVGILYPLKKEPAYSTIRMGLAGGRVLGFLLGAVCMHNSSL